MHFQPPTTGPAHALVVEDDPVTREFLDDALQSAGWSVELARDVAESLLKVQGTPPDLVLCDLRLPDGDAFDVARALWSDPAASRATRPYAIALSAEVDEALRARLHGAGYQIVFSKPVSLSNLLAALPAHASTSAMSNPDCIPQAAAPDAGEPEVLDDAAALAVCGSMQTVASLRALFANDLTHALTAIENAHAAGDTATLHETLHRLRASCGFCGAAALGAAVARVPTNAGKQGEGALAVAQVLTRGSALALRLVDGGGRGTQQ